MGTTTKTFATCDLCDKTAEIKDENAPFPEGWISFNQVTIYGPDGLEIEVSGDVCPGYHKDAYTANEMLQALATKRAHEAYGAVEDLLGSPPNALPEIEPVFEDERASDDLLTGP